MKNFLVEFAHLCMVALVVLVLAAVVAVFTWAGVPALTVCAGTAPIVAVCLLVIALGYIYPYFFKSK